MTLCHRLEKLVRHVKQTLCQDDIHANFVGEFLPLFPGGVIVEGISTAQFFDLFW